MQPSITTRSFIRGTSILSFALVLLAGCDQVKDMMGGQASATSCESYSKKVCTAAGEESGTCSSVKAATELMAPKACAAALADFAFTEKKLAESKKVCDTLSTKICSEFGNAGPVCEMVRTQTKSFDPERCQMMMEHVKEVVADLKQKEPQIAAEQKRREVQNKPLPPEKISAIAQNDAPSFGPEGSKVTIVEFSDFQCPFCSRAANVVEKVREKYGDRVRFVFRQFPLSFHGNARAAAEASLAANAQGKFWPYHDKLFADQSKLDRASLEAVAKDVGLDVEAFKKALDDKTFAAKVDADIKLGEDVAVDGTPTLFLNGKRVADPTDFEGLSKALDEALSGKPAAAPPG